MEVNYYLMNLHIDIVLMLLILLFLLIKYIIFIIQSRCRKIESKELKYDFGLDNFALDKFYATEAAHRFMLVAYNIMALLNIKFYKQILTFNIKILFFCIRILDDKSCEWKSTKYITSKEKKILDGWIIWKYKNKSPSHININKIF